jgi:hypothetical protein
MFGRIIEYFCNYEVECYSLSYMKQITKTPFLMLILFVSSEAYILA